MRAQEVSITADIWSDCSRSSYIGITAHTVNSDFSTESNFIGLKKLNEKHKAAYVQSSVEELLSSAQRDEIQYKATKSKKCPFYKTDTECQFRSLKFVAEQLELYFRVP